MTQGREDEAARRGRTAAAAVAALLCAWRLPRTLGLGADSTAIASHAVSVALAAGLYLLIKRALGFRDRALNRIGYGWAPCLPCSRRWAESWLPRASLRR